MMSNCGIDQRESNEDGKKWSYHEYSLKRELAGVVDELDMGYKGMREVNSDFEAFGLNNWSCC